MSRYASAQTGRGYNVHDWHCRGGRVPAGGHQRAEIVVVGHGRQALEPVGEAGLPIVAM